jgi:hypothetical protein
MAISFRFETAVLPSELRAGQAPEAGKKETACAEPAASLAAYFVGQHAAFQENGSARHLFPLIFLFSRRHVESIQAS